MRLLVALALVAVALAGCSDGETQERDPYEPTMPTGPVTSIEHIARLMDGDAPWPNASGIWVHEGIAYGSGLGNGFFIADVRDAPTLLYKTPENTETAFSRDADVVTNGRITLVLATQSDGMHLYDVTDPREPVFAARLLTDVPNHNVAVVPGTTYVFNSQSGGLGRTNELVDVADPFAPVVLGTAGDHGCHDITFHGTFGEPRFRAYCAGIDRTEIWDLDGLDPAAANLGIHVVATIEGTDSPVVGNPVFGAAPARTLHHLAMVSHDASILIIGDEHNGGGSPGACFGNADGISTPFGALWFYDLRDETDPQLLSWISPPTEEPRVPGNPSAPQTAVPNCTAHFGTLVPGEDKLVMAWYTAGVLLIDFEDPASPVILDQFAPDGINTWDARVVGDHVFTGDITRGTDVLRLS